MDPHPTPSPKKRRRGIYLLPNLFTTSALFAGFYGVLSAMQSHFEPAAIAIFAAMLLDGLDGRVARLTQTQSDFGAEYDSLSDMVAFGIAPALVVYEWALKDLGKVGWLAAFIYTATTALRLARFNTQLGVADKRYFQGLPSPSAAAILASGVWIGASQTLQGEWIQWLAALLTVFTGLLMVSNFRYYSFKELELRGRVSFVVAVVMTLSFAFLFLHPPVILFLLFLLYGISGPTLTLMRRRQWRLQRRAIKDSDRR